MVVVAAAMAVETAVTAVVKGAAEGDVSKPRKYNNFISIIHSHLHQKFSTSSRIHISRCYEH